MATIAENTQENFDNAEAIVVDMLQTAKPDVSFRKGTVLRELLVRPAAELYAADARRIEESMAARSLKLMKEAGTASADDVNAILANFSASLHEGRAASGRLFVQVAEDAVYTVPEGTVFKTPYDLKFTVLQTYIATSADVTGDEYLQLSQSADGQWYFLLPVEAAGIGSKYEIKAGVRLYAEPSFDGLVSAYSYEKFRGGVDEEKLSDAIDRLESDISLRGLGSRLSIQSTLLGKNAGNFSGKVLACSVAGFGDPEQIRDRNNVFGIATGGKVDIFARTAPTPESVSFVKTGVWDSDSSSYVVHIRHDEAPGYYAVKSVTDANAAVVPGSSGGSGMLSSGSYVVEELFSVSEQAHGVLSGDPRMAFCTSYRDVELRIKRDKGKNDPDSVDFLVEVYASPTVADVQEYVDRSDVRSLMDDILVRAAPICLVQISASVSVREGHEIPDLEEMKQAVADYVNGRNFVPRLAASEIVAVLNKFDISRVEMMFGTGNGFKMKGRLKNASGGIVSLPGPDFDIEAHADPVNLVSANTVCFGMTAEDVEIKIVDDRK